MMLDEGWLPPGFSYPRELVRWSETGVRTFEPWRMLHGEQLQWRVQGLRERYSDRCLVPFAERSDCDDVACVEAMSGDVVIVHDYAEPGFEERARFNTVDQWIRSAVEDFIEFGQD
jgi:hypothetical protein